MENNAFAFANQGKWWMEHNGSCILWVPTLFSVLLASSSLLTDYHWLLIEGLCEPYTIHCQPVSANCVDIVLFPCNEFKSVLEACFWKMRPNRSFLGDIQREISFLRFSNPSCSMKGETHSLPTTTNWMGEAVSAWLVISCCSPGLGEERLSYWPRPYGGCILRTEPTALG